MLLIDAAWSHFPQHVYHGFCISLYPTSDHSSCYKTHLCFSLPCMVHFVKAEYQPPLSLKSSSWLKMLPCKDTVRLEGVQSSEADTDISYRAWAIFFFK